MAKKTAKKKVEKASEMDWFTQMNQKAEELKKNAMNDLRSISVDLHAKGITACTLDYSGEGDSGDINYVSFEKDPAFGELKRNEVSDEIKNKLKDVAFRFLPGGFEINDGGFGEVVIDFTTASIVVKHNERVVETTYFESEYDFDGKAVR